ncbi:hypothetical protein ACP275_14G016200 [Erythranthe tilingii]
MENQCSFCINTEFLLLPATIVLFFYMKRRRNDLTMSRPLPPGRTGYPIIGCLPEMIRNRPTFRWIHKLMQETDTEIACIRLGSTHVIIVTSPELSREFLKKHDLIFASRPHCYLSTVISPIGDQWKKMRRILSSHVLSPAMHRKLHEKRGEEADHLVRYVYTQLLSPQNNHNHNNGLVNLRVATQHYCGNVIRKAVFGKRFFGPGMEDGGPGLEEREHVDGLFTILRHLYGFAIADYVPCLEVFDFDGYRKILRDARNNVTKYQDPEITNRVEMWRKGIKKTEDDILDVFINLKDSEHSPLLSVQEIRAQITEMMLAGVDNPSNAVMLLARLLQGFDWTAPPSGVDLVESEGDLLLAKPLVLHATPRLEPWVLLK